MSADERKRRGAWDTPQELVDHVVDGVLDPDAVRRRAKRSERPMRVLDPACGDGRFLAAVAARVPDVPVELVGIDVDPSRCAAAAGRVPIARIHCADALADRWRGDDRPFDLVVGNPPFLSQMALATTRGGASDWGGGPYADAAVEFLALAAAVVDPNGGRVALILPQSVLAARDAADVRRRYDEQATMIWSSWSARRWFDAQVHTCALGFEFGRHAGHPDGATGSDPAVRRRRRGGATWSHVVTDRAAVPPVPDADPPGAPTLDDVAWLNANFRDEYYALVPAVGDDVDGPPLVTSGVIDPAVCRWGTKPVRFAKRTLAAPRVDLEALDDRMREWARRRLVPKVLVANQTRVVEAVCDPTGDWLPGVPVVGVYPHDGRARTAWEIAAVLTSPFASAWAWSRQAGTGLSASAIRVGPGVLGRLPWPGGPREDLAPAVDALRDGDVVACGVAVEAAYGLEPDARRWAWWTSELDRLDRRASSGRQPEVAR